MVVDVVVLRVLHPHPEGLGAPVHAVVPPEVGRHRQAHAEHGPRNGLQMSKFRVGSLLISVIIAFRFHKTGLFPRHFA